MKALLRPLLFSFALILAFASVTYVLPQMRGEAPEEKEVKLGELTVDGYAALGEELYAGKGTCTLCHNQLGRAPDMLAYDAVKVAAERIADPRYKGKAKEAESYLRESMVEPSAYVVKGFGKKGTDDTESPMPAVHQPPIQLSDRAANPFHASGGSARSSPTCRRRTAIRSRSPCPRRRPRPKRRPPPPRRRHRHRPPRPPSRSSAVPRATRSSAPSRRSAPASRTWASA